MIGTEDDDIIRLIVLNQVERLEDRVRRSGVPAGTEALLRRHWRDEITEHRGLSPSRRDVTIERVRLVLRQHCKASVTRIGKVGKHEIDEAISPAKWHCWLGAIGGEWHEPLAFATSEHEAQDARCTPHGLLLSDCLPKPYVARLAPPRLGRVKLAITTREWPPEVYGGAGVHVTELVKALRHHIDVDVFCMGAERDDAQAFPLVGPEDMNAALKVMAADVQMAAAVTATDADVVHSHTWYANMAGHLAGATRGVPHVISAHSLEPDRPWKLYQLGGGYRVSSWIEQEAYRAAATIIAVSHGMRADVLRAYPFLDPNKVVVVHNGVDTSIWKPSPDEAALLRMGIDPTRPYVLFVGRITRQKGLVHLLAAAHHFPMGVQIVLAASSPDEPGIGEEVSSGIATLAAARPGDVVWLNTNVAKATSSRCKPTPQCFCAPRCMSRSAS